MSLIQQIIVGMLFYMFIGLVVGIWWLLKSGSHPDPDTDRVKSANILKHMLFEWPIHVYVYCGLKFLGKLK